MSVKNMTAAVICNLRNSPDSLSWHSIASLAGSQPVAAGALRNGLQDLAVARQGAGSKQCVGGGDNSSASVALQSGGRGRGNHRLGASGQGSSKRNAGRGN